jgi:hypothetical protein
METSQPTSPAPTEALLQRADEFARRDPTKAVVSVFGAGLLLHLLPIGAIVGGFAALALTLARPILLLLGVMKACELSRKEAKKTS